jgi:dienelactone hydrolase
LSFHGRLFSKYDLQLRELFTMTQWLKPGTRLACRLAQTACISALLAATLSGCNEDKTSSDTTFDVPAVKTVVTAEVPKDEPVKGTVTVGKPAQDPVTTGGFAIPLATKVGRFTEIAPDTAGGATFRSSPEMDYDLGNLVASVANDLTSASDDKFFISQVAGWIRYPQDPKPLAPKGRFPVIVFEHGQHSPSDPSYKGYDYLAEELASHGYVVLSVDGNAINAGPEGGDWSGQARAQLILGTLDRLQEIDKKGQVDESGEAGPLDVLKGKLDFTRVGIMGHSRGGQGVSNAIKYNQTRVGVSESDLIKALQAAPDFFKAKYPDLVAAITPAKPQPVVTPAVAKIEKVVPAHIDEERFTLVYEQAKATLAGATLPDAETLKTLMLAGPTPFSTVFPELLTTIIPATTEMVDKEPTASIDETQFKVIYDRYNESPLVGGLLPDAESIKTLLLAGHFTLSAAFPDFLATVIPATAQPVVNDEGQTNDTNDNNEENQPNDGAKMTFEEAVKKYNIFYAAGRETIPPYDFKGAFMLAPMDNNANLGVNNVPLANLLPTCDGDVRPLYGARSFDHNRFGPSTDIAPRYQIQVFGADHNFYNTEWRDDDFGYNDKTSYCADNRSHSIRLNRLDQRRGGSFLINSFMRYHVGGEHKFATYWNGTAQLPNAACPSTDGPCDERIVLTVQKGAPSRKLIAHFERDDSIDRNDLGGTISLNDFHGSARCDMPIGGDMDSVGDCSPRMLDDFGFGASGIDFDGFQSIADHLELSWSNPNPSIVTDLKGLSAKGMDSLTFRIGVVRPMGQEVEVTLTDSAGKTAMLKASDFSNATYNAPRKKSDEEPAVTHLDGAEDKKATSIPMVDHPDDIPFADGQVKILMNMVAIPLAAFEGVDTNSLKELKLVFPKESGKVAITDIELQNLGREKPAQKLARQ